MPYRTFLCLFLCLFFSINYSNAQSSVITIRDIANDRTNTISAKYDIDFNLPQFDIAFRIPAQTTFRLPVTIGDDVALEINKESFYSFDLDNLVRIKTRSILFYNSYKDKHPSLILEIEPIEDKEVDALDKNEQITPIKSELGKSTTNSITIGGVSFNKHTFIKDAYYFNFYLNADSISEKYQSIIESIKSKNLSRERDQYNNRVKYRYYKLEKNPRLPSNENYIFDYYKGKTTRDEKAVNLFSETEIDIPANTEYMISANYVEEVGNDSLLMYVDINDFINKGQCVENYFFYDFNLSISSWMGIEDLDSYIKSRAGNAAHFRSEVSHIGQDSLFIYYYGSKDNVTLDLNIPTVSSSSILNICVFNYSEKTKDKVLKMLSTFRYQGESLPTNIGGLIVLEKEAPIDFVSIPLPEFDKDLVLNNPTLTLKDLDVTLPLLGPIEQYELITSAGSENIPLDGIIATAKPQDRNGLTIMRDGDPLILFIQTVDKPTDLDEDLRDWVKSWNSYSSFGGLEAGFVTYNKQRWNIVFYQSGDSYSATASTYTNGCSISFYVNNSKDKEALFETLAYIQTFDFLERTNIH